ncbi:MAG: redoxin family protein [Alphaproteobacteria bacterium]
MKAHPFSGVIFFATLLCVTFPSYAENPPAQMMPVFQVKELQTGQVLTQENFKGKVAVINFFASWCAGCKNEHALLMRMAQAGITIHGVSVDETASAALQMLRYKGNPYSLIGHDASGNVQNIWGISGLPISFVIDKRGVVQYSHRGALTEETVRAVIIPLVLALEKQIK